MEGELAKRAQQVARTADKRDDAEFASVLLEAAASFSDRPKHQALLYEKTVEFGFGAGRGHGVRSGYDFALRAIKRLMEIAPDRVKQWEEQELNVRGAIYRADRDGRDPDKTNRATSRYLDYLVIRADAAIASGQAKEAHELLTAAASLLRHNHPRWLEVDALRRAVYTRLAVERDRQGKERLLQSNPKDRLARDGLVLLLLLEFDDPAEAAKLIDASCSQEMQTFVPLAARPAKEQAPQVCLELGHWYEELRHSRKSPAAQRTALSRAGLYYQRAEADAALLGQAKLAFRRVEQEFAKVKVPGGIPLGRHLVRTIRLAEGVEMELVFILPGSFLMGCAEPGRDGKAGQGPPYEVELTKPFYMGITEVTQAQYEAVMAANPSKAKDPRNPVENASWNDAVKFCEALGSRTGETVRLPTEAQWEYACSTGRTTRFCFGDDDEYLDEFAWYKDNSGETPHPVAQKRPNRWGLYDMHGNLWERTIDYYTKKHPAEGRRQDPTGPPEGHTYVNRGGAFNSGAALCATAYRLETQLSAFFFPQYGFRVVIARPGAG